MQDHDEAQPQVAPQGGYYHPPQDVQGGSIWGVPPPPPLTVTNRGDLSFWMKTFWVLLFFLWLLITVSLPKAGAFLPFFTIPIGLWYYAYKKYSNSADLDLSSKLFAAGFAPGSLIVLIVEAILAIIFAVVCFSDQFDDWRQELEHSRKTGNQVEITVKKTVGFWFFLFFISFFVAGLVEEALKYVLTSYVKRYRPGFADLTGYLLFATAGALGFSTVENCGYIISAAAQKAADGSMATWGAVFFNVLGRMFISTPLHLCTAALSCFNIFQRDVALLPIPRWRILGLPIFFHGLFDFLLLIIYAAYNGNDSHPAVIGLSVLVAVVVFVGLFFALRWEYKRMIQTANYLPLGRSDGVGMGNPLPLSPSAPEMQHPPGRSPLHVLEDPREEAGL